MRVSFLVNALCEKPYNLLLKTIHATGEGIDNFWQVLVEGRNCTVEIPLERFDTKEWYDPDDNKPGKICTTQAALLDR